MADVVLVTGPPFSGKAQYVRDEIERREGDGELGLVLLDWTALFAALVPGIQSSYRDERVSETGSPRMVSAAFAFAAGAIAARELRGYVTSQSPRQAVDLAIRYSWEIVEVGADPGDVADRARAHMTRLRRRVRRAAEAGAALLANCRRAAVAYYREQPALEGKARVVRRTGKGWKMDAGTKPGFDRDLWLRGLTPAAKDAVAELVSLGNPEPTPADVMAFLLRDRR